MLGRILKKALRPEERLELPETEQSPATLPYLPPPELWLPERAARHHEHYQGRKVLALTMASMSDGLGAGISVMSELYPQHGYEFIVLDLRQSGWMERIAGLLRKPEEVCCVIGLMSLMGDLRELVHGQVRNAWEEAGVPFISILGDHPAYFFDRHKPVSRGHVSLYCFQEHLDAARQWLDPVPIMARIALAAWHPVERSAIDFSAKAEGKVCFFKNGNSPASLRAFWETLPAPISRWLKELAHGIDLLQIGRSGLPLHVLVRDYIADRGYVMDEKPWIELFLVAQLDDYARRVKSTMIAEALLDLPVMVYGSFWEHVDFTGRRATHLPGLSYFDTRELVASSLCILDMSPNTQSAPHDRFLASIGRHTLCLTNVQKYYEDNYALADQMMFEFDPESIRERVSGVLARPAQAVELGAEIAAQAREIQTGKKAVDALIEMAHLARFAHTPVSFPGQQNFAVWPR